MAAAARGDGLTSTELADTLMQLAVTVTLQEATRALVRELKEELGAEIRAEIEADRLSRHAVLVAEIVGEIRGSLLATTATSRDDVGG